MVKKDYVKIFIKFPLVIPVLLAYLCSCKKELIKADLKRAMELKGILISGGG